MAAFIWTPCLTIMALSNGYNPVLIRYHQNTFTKMAVENVIAVHAVTKASQQLPVIQVSTVITLRRLIRFMRKMEQSILTPKTLNNSNMARLKTHASKIVNTDDRVSRTRGRVSNR